VAETTPAAERDRLGQLVRSAWEDWAWAQPDVDTHPSWTAPYDLLPERDREVNRRIGEAVAADVRGRCADELRAHAADATAGWLPALAAEWDAAP
jgi:hypothetical protein